MDQKDLAMLQRQTDINKAFGKVYFAIYSVDLVSGRYLEVSTLDIFRKHIPPTEANKLLFDMVIKHYVSDGYKEGMREFLDMNTLQERLSEQNSVSHEFFGTTQGWCRASLVVERRDELGRIERFIYATQEINQEIKSEQDRIAELKQAYAAADLARDAKTDFLFRMSHSIHTPLNAIMGFNDLLLKQDDISKKASGYAEKIKASSDLLLSLLDGVLNLTKSAGGSTGLAVKQSEFKLDKLINELDVVIRTQTAKKDQIFIVEKNDIPHNTFIGDQTMISRVIFELLNNAVKYTSPGGTVTFCVYGYETIDKTTDRIVFKVRDTGIGISKEQQKSIFDIPSLAAGQAADAPKSLSLIMAKSFTDMMGGMISVQSNPGHGSEFTVELPLKIYESAESSESKTDIATKDVLVGLHILVVDDNDLNMEVITELLEIAGANCDTAPGGQDAIDKVSGSKPGEYDLVLMDIRMPDIDGYEATRRIRALDRPDAKSMLIVALSANSFDEDIENAKKAGMNAHLAKPLSMKTLRRTVKELLAK